MYYIHTLCYVYIIDTYMTVICNNVLIIIFNVYLTALSCFDGYARTATLITDKLRIALILITDSCYWNLPPLKIQHKLVFWIMYNQSLVNKYQHIYNTCNNSFWSKQRKSTWEKNRYLRVLHIAVVLAHTFLLNFSWDCVTNFWL